MPIRTLLFDLGNVLLYFSHDRMCEQIAEAAGIPKPRLQELLFAGGLQLRLERGDLDEDGFHRVIEELAGTTLDRETLRRAGCDIFAINDRLLDLLPLWKRAGYRLVLLSNTCVSHYQWVRERYDVLSHFDACVLSFEVRAVKPEEAIFRAALARIGCSAQECFYTDDVPHYVERGREMGLQAETYIGVPALLRQLGDRGVVIPSVANSPE